MHEPGVDVLGPLPPEIQAVTVFSAAMCKTCAHRDATKALLAFLASPQTRDAKRRHGLDPA
jgi:molybdate transport system substrate-binding protein